MQPLFVLPVGDSFRQPWPFQRQFHTNVFACYVPFSPLFPWLVHGLLSSQDPPLAFELRGLFHIVRRQRFQPPGSSATCPFRFGFVPITNSLRTKVSFLAHFVCASRFHARSAAKHDVGRLGRFQLPASADGLRFRRFFFVLARSVHAPAFLPRICTVAGAFARLADVAMAPFVRTFIVESFRNSTRCRMTRQDPSKLRLKSFSLSQYSPSWMEGFETRI